MQFNFSIRQALRASWRTFKAHAAYFIALSIVMIVLNAFNRQTDDGNFLITSVVIIAALILSYMWLSISLAAADERHDLLTFKTLKHHLPNVKEFFMIIGVGIATGFIVLVGLIALIIPGIYFLVRLTFANLSYVDRKQGVKDAVKHSWHLVEGKKFWTVFLVMITMLAFIVLGAAVVVVGLAVTYPIALIMQARLYRALDAHKGGEMIVQPKELPEHM